MSQSQANLLAVVGRVMLAALFILSGFGKITAAESTQGYIASVGLPLPFLSYLIAVVVELGGGLLLLIGFQTRIVSLGIAAFSLVAAVVFHHDFADQNQMVHFLKNIAISGGLLQIAAFGAGALSLDGRRTQAV